MIESLKNTVSEKNNSTNRCISKFNIAEEKKINELEDSSTNTSDLEIQRESTFKKETRQSTFTGYGEISKSMILESKKRKRRKRGRRNM